MVAMSGGEERAGGTDDMLVKEQRTRKMPARSGFLCTPNSLGLPPLAGPGRAVRAWPFRTLFFSIYSTSLHSNQLLKDMRGTLRAKKQRVLRPGTLWLRALRWVPKYWGHIAKP